MLCGCVRRSLPYALKSSAARRTPLHQLSLADQHPSTAIQWEQALSRVTTVSSFMSRGLFFSLDGLDGGGKSTQCRLLADWLRRRRLPSRLLCRSQSASSRRRGCSRDRLASSPGDDAGLRGVSVYGQPRSTRRRNHPDLRSMRDTLPFPIVICSPMSSIKVTPAASM